MTKLPSRAGFFSVGILVVAFGLGAAGMIFAGANGAKSWVDPDAGLSHGEALHVHESLSKEFFERLPLWIEETAPKVGDLAKLERHPLNVSVSGPDASMDVAAESADLIVVGTVTAVQSRGSLDTLISFEVESVVKGPATGKVVAIVVPGGIRPYPDWDHVVLGYAESAPIPFVGDRLVLLLNQRDEEPATFGVRHWTGLFAIDADGSVSALALNPWAAEIDGSSLGEFVDQLGAVVAGS
jgi:hypothetical protein